MNEEEIKKMVYLEYINKILKLKNEIQYLKQYKDYNKKEFIELDIEREIKCRKELTDNN